jgi:DNA repair photolyase
MTEKTGTKEWSNHSLNMFIGCKHNCIYCYGRATPPGRIHLKKRNSWDSMIRTKKSYEKARKLNGQIMFPTLHDILSEHLDDTVKYLIEWLKEGNMIVIVSKPHLECIRRLCKDLNAYKEQITFRFTIGSMDKNTLKFWEPNAPLYKERKESLIYAYNEEYKTSVSCEPRLKDDTQELIEELSPFVTHSLWLGMMNKTNKRVDKTNWTQKDYQFSTEVDNIQTPTYLQALYDTYKNNHIICWKNELRKTLGLPNTVNRGKQ